VPKESGGPSYVRLDLAREWLLIRALVTSPAANVQWLFISAPIEALLTEYARARGEDASVVWHAENLMLQPKDSLPHDDHLHLRTACLPEETVLGCEGGGPYWPWLPAWLGGVSEPDDEALLLALLTPIPVDRVPPAAEPLVTLPSPNETTRAIQSAGRPTRPADAQRPDRGN
jgi:penicillin-insensitive murein endopeptidase